MQFYILMQDGEALPASGLTRRTTRFWTLDKAINEAKRTFGLLSTFPIDVVECHTVASVSVEVTRKER